MMMGFYRHLSPYVREGSKRHTIREGDRWKVGDRADQYIEPRQTNPSELIWRVPVCRVEHIVIERSPTQWTFSFSTTDAMDCDFCGAVKVKGHHSCSQGPVIVSIEGARLADDECSSFLWRDGFRADGVEGAQAMALEHWRKPLIKKGEVLGQLIHWLYEHRTDSRDLRSAEVQDLDALCARIRKAGGWTL